MWRVIRRDGVDGASVRWMAREAGCSPGGCAIASPASQSCRVRHAACRRPIEDRIAALATPEDPRKAVEHVLFELLPLDNQ
jgi:hypothetical protein